MHLLINYSIHFIVLNLGPLNKIPNLGFYCLVGFVDFGCSLD